MSYPIVQLKSGRSIHTRNRHPWIFKGAIEHFPSFAEGDILAVQDSDGRHLGHGYFTTTQSIAGRMLNFDHSDPLESVTRNLEQAITFRGSLFGTDTTAYRLVNGEADGLPGLIVDQYNTVLVVQHNTRGMDKLRDVLMRELVRLVKPTAIFEHSTSATRTKEGLAPITQWIYETTTEPIFVQEHGLMFPVNVTTGQKTGLFLDQREMRVLVKEYATRRTVLNCFGYSGGFSMYALAGGALRADTLDTDTNALVVATETATAQGYSKEQHEVIARDAFAFLSAPLPHPYDFIILDPPAFAKKSSDVTNAARGYRELNRLAMQHLPSNGLLLTASCSQYIDPALFRTVIFNAAKDAKREVQILSLHRMAADHPVSIYFPDGEYLKGLLLRVL